VFSVADFKIFKKEVTKPFSDLRASPRVCQILLGKSCVLPTSKKIYKVKKSSSPTVWHNSLAKFRSNLHQES
jgi:hypothetical protein